ncbi:DsbA family protein [Pseudoalteromonas tunicata]|uniref:DsbA family protein n=1 Tax=Pseudoalteromonas tunicata TaxID=314281 RepID=UPI00273EC509|nr:DsbA family protein [Pseudoalteromonas tunicata]MDP4984316.1 DsbA family protein [Pseudoalteromonas tunicata]
MQCDSEQGCVLPKSQQPHSAKPSHLNAADVVFVTDPICSHCWAIEPAWRRLNCNFSFTTRYIHGGLLPGWQGFGDAGNGISGPLDVIPHWQQVAAHYQQPIDPSVWRTDPITNSYILCKAALVARQLQPHRESDFVRFMREKIFLLAINLSDEQKLLACVAEFGFDVDTFQSLLHSASISSLFLREQQEMLALGARGFPSIIFLSQFPERVVGSASYVALERALLLQNNHKVKPLQLTDEQKLLRYPSWTLKEATEVLQCTNQQARELLNALNFNHSIIAQGDFWQK